jgi:hypothetical protein
MRSINSTARSNDGDGLAVLVLVEDGAVETERFGGVGVAGEAALSDPDLEDVGERGACHVKNYTQAQRLNAP